MEVSGSEFAHTVESGNAENFTVTGSMYAGKSYEDLPFLEAVNIQEQQLVGKIKPGSDRYLEGYRFNRSGLPESDDGIEIPAFVTPYTKDHLFRDATPEYHLLKELAPNEAGN